MKRYTCECCGGTIDLRTMKCEYCGVQYARDVNTPELIYKVEHYTNPVMTFGASATINYEAVEHLGAERVAEFAVRELSNKLAACIPQNMVVTTERDLLTGGLKVRGTIKIVQPVNNAESWVKSDALTMPTANPTNLNRLSDEMSCLMV